MGNLHPTHVKEPTRVSAGAPQWYATFCAKCGQRILEESGDVTVEGEEPCAGANA